MRRTEIMKPIKMIRAAVEKMVMMDVGGELVKSEYQQSGPLSNDFFNTLCFKYLYSTRFIHVHPIPMAFHDAV